MRIAKSRPSRIPGAAAGELLVDAAVFGGRDRWQRRLRGLEHEFELRLKIIERDDDSRRGSIEKKLGQLREFEAFALPLIDILSGLRTSNWKTWIEEAGDLARAALRKPEPVLAMLANSSRWATWA